MLFSLPDRVKWKLHYHRIQKRVKIFGFQSFYFFLDKLNYLVYSPVNFLSSLPYSHYSLGVEKWIKNRALN